MRGRARGYGTLKIESQHELLRLVALRKSLTNKALAARFHITEHALKGYVSRYRAETQDAALA